MERLKSYILTIWVQLRDLFLYVFRHAIILNGYVDDHTWRGIRHRNWGDDLNYYLLRKLTGHPVICYHNFKLAKWFHLKNYLCIGTLLDAVKYSNAQTIIWGSGVSGLERSFVHPHKILSVRGPKTKEFCDRYQVKCPEVYGDPALLLPRMYRPERGAGDKFQVLSVASLGESEQSSNSSSKFFQSLRLVKASRARTQVPKYKMGIIPHVVDQQHPVIQEIRDKYADEILIIDLAHYERWTDVIDQICSCEKILSSSLHGIIVSDAYQIPNCWIELTGKISGGYFKYHDYASSVHREFTEPARIELVEDLFSLTTACAQKDIILKLQKDIIDCCPFHLKSIT